MGRRPLSAPREIITSLRLSTPERSEMQVRSDALGFKSISDYLRHLHKAAADAEKSRGAQIDINSYGDLFESHATDLGTIYQGNSLAYLHNYAEKESVNLIMTSPPFGLIRKKAYGNEDADAYCDWFRPFAEGFKRVLKKDGSLVIDVGGAWKPGTPTRSLYHYKLLVMLCEEYGFHLAQEHYWWNPSKLPSPAEWVNIRRVRVKDAINCVWWLSKTPFPKASNRRVLAPYSGSMRSLLKNGYKAKMRPSGHDISTKFSIDNGGAVPPNLLAIANTESNGAYQDYCRDNEIGIHPARFPSLLTRSNGLGIVLSDRWRADEASSTAAPSKLQKGSPDNAKNATSKVANSTCITDRCTQTRLIKTANRVTFACTVVGIKAQCRELGKVLLFGRNQNTSCPMSMPTASEVCCV